MFKKEGIDRYRIKSFPIQGAESIDSAILLLKSYQIPQPVKNFLSGKKAIVKRLASLCADLVLCVLHMGLKLMKAMACLLLICFLLTWLWQYKACTTVTEEDKYSPSRQWHVYKTSHSCSSLGSSYEIYLKLAPAPAFFKQHPEMRSETIFTLDLTASSYNPGYDAVDWTWKDDRHLEITAPSCHSVCTIDREKPEDCVSDSCLVVSLHDGVTVTVAPSPP